jgi:murein DD-endopeptidase MepM/ murein hydrolase activator NlpD
MRHTVLSSSSGRLLVILALAVVPAVMLSVAAFDASTAVAHHDSLSMKMPFHDSERWKVINGYNSGLCHHVNPPPRCGGNQQYAFDIVPESGEAGKKPVYSPVAGTVVYRADKGTIGWLVKIETDDRERLVHLYHLMNVQVAIDQRVRADTVVGYVYDQYDTYNGAPDHLHFHVSNSSGSIPLKLSGKKYGVTKQWNGQQLQNNDLYQHTNYGGAWSNIVVTDPDLRDNFVGDNTASSVRVNPGCVMTLHADPNYFGHSESFSGNDPNLATHGFNDKASSLTLTC